MELSVQFSIKQNGSIVPFFNTTRALCPNREDGTTWLTPFELGAALTERTHHEQMTVTRGPPPNNRRTDEAEGMLQKHWGTTRTVEVSRDGDKSKGIGISIVGGKVDLFAPGSDQETVLGIFVKSVVPGGPADRTGQLKVRT